MSTVNNEYLLCVWSLKTLTVKWVPKISMNIEYLVCA